MAVRTVGTKCDVNILADGLPLLCFMSHVCWEREHEIKQTIRTIKWEFILNQISKSYGIHLYRLDVDCLRFCNKLLGIVILNRSQQNKDSSGNYNWEWSAEYH